MELGAWTRVSDHQWRLEPRGKMRVPAIVYATPELMAEDGVVSAGGGAN